MLLSSFFVFWFWRAQARERRKRESVTGKKKKKMAEVFFITLSFFFLSPRLSLSFERERKNLLFFRDFLRQRTLRFLSSLPAWFPAYLLFESQLVSSHGGRLRGELIEKKRGTRERILMSSGRRRPPARRVAASFTTKDARSLSLMARFFLP